MELQEEDLRKRKDLESKRGEKRIWITDRLAGTVVSRHGLRERSAIFFLYHERRRSKRDE